MELSAVLRLFYQTGLRYISILGISPENRLQWLGYVTRDRLDTELADIERIKKEYKGIPPEMVESKDVPDALLSEVSKGLILALDPDGERVEGLSEADLLRAIAEFRERKSIPAPLEEGSIKKEPEDSQTWLTKLILSSLPDPLFAADLQGKTLFFNESFESMILAKDVFKKSIRLAESWLLEWNRKLLADYYTKTPSKKTRPLGYAPEIKNWIDISNLESNGKIIGYLYRFRHENLSVDEYNIRIERGLGIDEVMREIESDLIRRALVRNSGNISHTATHLALRRSTLQNRMHLLNIRISESKDAAHKDDKRSSSVEPKQSSKINTVIPQQSNAKSTISKSTSTAKKIQEKRKDKSKQNSAPKKLATKGKRPQNEKNSRSKAKRSAIREKAVKNQKTKKR